MLQLCSFFFFFNNPATTEIYPLPLHAALPIYTRRAQLLRPLLQRPLLRPIPRPARHRGASPAMLLGAVLGEELGVGEAVGEVGGAVEHGGCRSEERRGGEEGRSPWSPDY